MLFLGLQLQRNVLNVCIIMCMLKGDRCTNSYWFIVNIFFRGSWIVLRNDAIHYKSITYAVIKLCKTLPVLKECNIKVTINIKDNRYSSLSWLWWWKINHINIFWYNLNNLYSYTMKNRTTLNSYKNFKSDLVCI